MRIRIGAVSYLNTVPLVWGMLHGEEQANVALTFSLPSVCADEIESGLLDVGLVPVAEIGRQNLEIVSDFGIVAHGAVRSILLISNKPLRQIRTLAADLSSRTSVQLAKIILRERYGVEPQVTAEEPKLGAMLDHADAALIIGDPALRIEPALLSQEWLDLGAEWHLLTGLPMVFAAWASKSKGQEQAIRALTANSYAFGRSRLDAIAREEYSNRGITYSLAAEYLTRYIQYVVGPSELAGLSAFLELAGLRKASLASSVL